MISSSPGDTARVKVEELCSERGKGDAASKVKGDGDEINVHFRATVVDGSVPSVAREEEKRSSQSSGGWVARTICKS